MQHIVVDIETNGTVCPIYSMVSIGAVHHENPENTFYEEMRPLNQNFQVEAYRVNGFTNAQVMKFGEARWAIRRFHRWVKSIQGNDKRIMFVSDTTSFDFSFVNYYLWKFCEENPFGHAPLSLSNLYKGVTGDPFTNMHHLRDTKHTHNALDDAKGNQEAFVKIQALMKEQRDRLRAEESVSIFIADDGRMGLDFNRKL